MFQIFPDTSTDVHDVLKTNYLSRKAKYVSSYLEKS